QTTVKNTSTKTVTTMTVKETKPTSNNVVEVREQRIQQKVSTNSSGPNAAPVIDSTEKKSTEQVRTTQTSRVTKSYHSEYRVSRTVQQQQQQQQIISPGHISQPPPNNAITFVSESNTSVTTVQDGDKVNTIFAIGENKTARSDTMIELNMNSMYGVPLAKLESASVKGYKSPIPKILLTLQQNLERLQYREKEGIFNPSFFAEQKPTDPVYGIALALATFFGQLLKKIFSFQALQLDKLKKKKNCAKYNPK
ncbi:hypothetical protein RFI_04702, partial [Reticulomyxa filosa]